MMQVTPVMQVTPCYGIWIWLCWSWNCKKSK